MSLLVFLFVCVAGMLLGLLASPYDRLSRFVGVVSLAAALATALLLKPGDGVTLGEVELSVSWFAGFFLTTLATGSLLLCLTGLIAGWSERLAPAALATLVGVGLAVSAGDATVALMAAAAATAPAALIAGRARSTPLGVDVGHAELRTLAFVVGASTLAALTVTNTNWTAGDPTFVLALAFLALAGAVAVRSGAVPFHVPAALLSRSGEGVGLVLSLVWVPCCFALVALSWNATVFGVPGDWLDRAVVAVQVVAVATIVLGAVAALLHEEVEEVVAYSIVQDSGLILLAMTARDAGAAQPARLWLLVFVLAKSALVAWAAAMSWSFRTSSLSELRGWLRRSPLLGLALAAIVVATLGWPGNEVFQARATLVNLGLPAPVHFVGVAAILLSLVYYARLFGLGLLPPSESVRHAPGERPRRWKPAASEADVPALPAASAALDAEGRTDEDEELEALLRARRRARRRPSLDQRLAATWRLNGPLEAGLLVLAAAAIAAAVAFGAFGVAGATQSGIALDQVAAPVAGPGQVDDNGGEPQTSAEPTVPEPSPTASSAQGG